MYRFILLFLGISTFLFGSDEIVVNLQADSSLDAICFDLTEEKSSLEKGYLAKMQEALTFDFNYNGKTKVNPHGAKYRLKGTLAGKKLTVSLPSNQTESIDLTGSLGDDRRKVHALSDKILATLYHEKGIATSRILYIVRIKDGHENNATKWKSEVWEADYDGYNSRLITKENGLCVTPAFLFSKKFLYVSYKTGQSRIILSSLSTPEEKKKVSQIRGNQLMPAFTSKAKLLAFVSDATGNPEIFIQNFDPNKSEIKKPWQATFAPNGAQGSPTFSPDGRRMAFVSNKDGVPRIYVMDVPQPNASIKDLKPILITKQNRDNTSPAWSPDGKKLAYSAITKGVRQIWLYDFETKKESMLTKGAGHKENPSFANNSQHILYDMTMNESSSLYLIHIQQKESVKISKGSGDKRFGVFENML